MEKKYDSNYHRPKIIQNNKSNIFSIEIKMISNTSCPGFKLIDKVGVVRDVDQHEIKLTSSAPSYSNNNNNNIANNKNMRLPPNSPQIKASKPFIFYTSGVDGVIPQNNADIAFQSNFKDEFVKKISSTVGSSNSNCEQEENQTEHNTISNVPNRSALNDVERCSDGDPTLPTSMTQKLAGDISKSRSNKSENMFSKSDRQKSPMCRTKDQENAFRQIEVVHNYSKLNRLYNGSNCHAANASMDSSNSSNLDEDEDDEEVEEDFDEDCDYAEQIKAKLERRLSAMGGESGTITNCFSSVISIKEEELEREKCPDVQTECLKIIRKEGEDGTKIPPDHYARRPMNAFLIFCKRHRAIVKERYRNLENRSITKILGEWWASLAPKEKECYVDLAKQNKDAFFSANPQFKWYKLPAPPRRTLNTRPGNIDRPYFDHDEYQNEYKGTAQSCEDYYSNAAITTCIRNDPKNVSFFKLADETQMGELNNLMRPTVMSSSFDVLQEALGRRSDSFNSGCKRATNTSVDEPSKKIKRSNSDVSHSSSEEDLMPKKSSRLCKGKKYQELMNSGQFAVIAAKKQTSIKPSKTADGDINGHKVIMHNVRYQRDLENEVISTKDGKEIEEQFVLPDSPSKQQHYGCLSFDLEDKIKALPAQCLETYLQRKKNTNRKKKISPKKRYPPQSKPEAVALGAICKSQQQSPKTAQEAKEQIVGSQKRKARKESITRRDINSIQNDVQLMLSNVSLKAPQTITAVNQNTSSDLLILAEVAANHTGSVQ